MANNTKTVTITVIQLFNGETQGGARSHRVRTQRGLDRLVSRYAVGDGWGIRINGPVSPTMEGGWVLD